VLCLALDTASAATTVALGEITAQPAGSAGLPTVLAERTEIAANRHGELLAPLIVAVLEDAGAHPGDLERVIAGVGPGPFTGLRVGLVTAAALGNALGVPATGVCSLDAVAFAADRPWAEGFAVLSDARRREVYWAAYAEGRRLTDPSVARPADLPQLPPTVVGAGALLHRDSLPTAVRVDDTAPWPSAAALLALGQDPRWMLPLRPLYLRRPDAQPPGRPKAVTPA
jgi:tRNA threonylcarbamoyl adenosine modification protein YeaZ